MSVRIRKVAMWCVVMMVAVGVGWAQEESPVDEIEGVGEEQEIAQREELGEFGDSKTRQIEEITVTARKVEESLDDTPLSIRAFTADAVAELGILDVENVVINSPGVHFSNFYGNRRDPSISFRGMDTGSSSRLAQTSSAYIDGIYLPGTSTWVSVGAVERTEVVKGPQSALYGRSAFGGAINFVMKNPTPDFTGNAALTLGENSRVDAGVGIGGPISDKFSYHIFGRYFDYGGGYDNPFEGSETLGAQSTNALEGSLQWDISDSVSLKLRGFYSKDDDGPTAFAWFGESIHNCGPFETDGESGTVSYYCGELTPDLITNFGYDTRTQAADGANWPKDDYGMERDFLLGGLHIDAMLSENVALTAITGYINEEVEDMRDFSGTQTGLTYDLTQDTLLSQEIRVQGTSDKFEWLAGGYYLDAEYEHLNMFGCSDPDWLFMGFLPACPLFGLENVRGNFANIGGELPIRLVENTAVFGSFTWHVSDKVTLIADARLARETLDYGTVVSMDGTVHQLKDDFDSFTPRVVLDWKPNDLSTVYASISTGVKPGDFNAFVAEMPQNAIEAFEEEYGAGVAVPESKATNYEIGYKFVSRNGKHRFNGAVYLFDWENQQFKQNALGFDTNGDGVVDENDEISFDYTTVAGQSEIKGFEFLYSGWLGSHFNLMASYNYNDAKYKVFEDAFHARVWGSPDASGKTMPRSPKSSATLGLGYLTPIGGDWEFNARADYVYRGPSYTWSINLAETSAINRVSLRAGVRNDRWDLSIWMNNATGDDSIMAARRFSSMYDFSSPTWWAGLPGVREAGVTVRFIF